MKYAAIPTIYKGVQMRSRLEARWAATFDSLGHPWQYEPFDLNGWIPDFTWTDQLEPWDAVPLFEVKPSHKFDRPDDVASKIKRALGTEPHRYDVWLLGNDPSAMWRLERDGRWSLNSLDCSAAWVAAGNAVQWKAPRA